MNVLVSDPLPAGVASFQWQCVASGGATCPNASGTGAINESMPSFPAGGQVVYTVVATMTDTPPSSVINMVSVTPALDTVCEPDLSAAPCLADASVSVRANAVPVVAVPVNSTFMLLLMMLALVGTAVTVLRRA